MSKQTDKQTSIISFFDILGCGKTSMQQQFINLFYVDQPSLWQLKVVFKEKHLNLPEFF